MTAFVRKHGFEVQEHYLMDTAWLATFKHGSGGRTIGINSEVEWFNYLWSIYLYTYLRDRWTLWKESDTRAVTI